jgi:integrase/recombinase XerC
MKAYRQDFDAIAAVNVGDDQPMAGLRLRDITTESMRTAFARYAEIHEATSIRRCWSTWNVLCT